MSTYFMRQVAPMFKKQQERLKAAEGGEASAAEGGSAAGADSAAAGSSAGDGTEESCEDLAAQAAELRRPGGTGVLQCRQTALTKGNPAVNLNCSSSRVHSLICS
eukprot:2859728-Rhodomonas_salina.1